MYSFKITIINPLHGNVSIIFFIKDFYFSNQNRFYREWHCFTYSQISFMSGLTKDSWIFLSDSAFNLLQYPTSCIFQRSPLYTCEDTRIETENAIFVLLWKSFWICAPLKGSWGLSGSPSFSSEMLWHREILWQSLPLYYSPIVLCIWDAVYNLNCKY